MNLTDFINKYSGQLVNSSRGIQGQCVSVSALWQEDNGVVGIFGPTALAIWESDTGDWDKVPNTPDGVPSPGDIFFFGAAYGGGAGHTGIVVNANTSSVTLFEQNDPDGSTAHEKTYDYNDAEGWFHPHFLNNQGDQDMEDLASAQQLAFVMAGRDPSDPTNIEDLNEHHVGQNANDDIKNWWNSTERANYVAAQQTATQAIQATADQVPGLQAQVADLTAQIASLQTAVTPPVSDDGSVPVSVTVKPVPDAPVSPTSGFLATSHGQEILRAISTAAGIVVAAIGSIVTKHSGSTTDAVTGLVAGGGLVYNVINYLKDLLDPGVPN